MITAITTHSPEETFALGKALGGIAFEGAVIAITGPLGSGKTLFVQGLARGLGVPDTFYITSPSYTLINEYPGKVGLMHADLYRLAGQEDVESTGLFDMLHTDSVAAIEWADHILQEDLGEHLSVDFEIRDASIRRIQLTGYGQRYNNLIKELEKIYGHMRAVKKERKWV